MSVAKMVRLLWRAHRSEQGLTAIELAVVVSILAVLAGLVAGNTTGMSTSARGATQLTDTAEVQKAVDSYVGQQPNAIYPVAATTPGPTPIVVVTCDGKTPVATITPAANGLAPKGSGDCVQLNVNASYRTPDFTPVSKMFVSDFMQRNPKHASDSPSPIVNGNSWVIDESGRVWNVLSKDQY